MFWVRAFEVLFLLIIPLVQTILKYLGVGVIAYVGINMALDKILDYLKTSLGSIPSEMLNIFGLMHFDTGVNIYFSAVVAHLVIKGLDKATDKKKSFVLKA